MYRRIFDWPLVNESARNIIKRTVSKIWTAAPILYFLTRGTAVQILKAIRFFISRGFIYERSDTNIRDWSMAYSFICTINFDQYLLTINQIVTENKIENTCRCSTCLRFEAHIQMKLLPLKFNEWARVVSDGKTSCFL